MDNVNIKIIIQVVSSVDGNTVDHFSIQHHQVSGDTYAKAKALGLDSLNKLEALLPPPPTV